MLTEHGMPIAPSTFYAHHSQGLVSQADWDDAHLANRLLDLWNDNRSLYGAEKLWVAALDGGLQIGRDQVGRLMGIVGIEGVRRGRQHHTTTTVADRSAPRHPDLIKRQWNTPDRPDMWWTADFTYVWTLAGFVYVAFVTDVFSRRILGWRVATSKTTALVLAALDQALFTRRRHNPTFTSAGLVHHSDAGSQYTAISFTEALIEAKMAPSIGTVGDALDNALQESTIGLYKTELIEHRRTRAWTGAAEVERETAGWVHWFNTTRIHLSIGRMPPVAYEEAWAARQEAQPASA